MVCSRISSSRLEEWAVVLYLFNTENARRRGSVTDDYTEQGWCGNGEHVILQDHKLDERAQGA